MAPYKKPFFWLLNRCQANESSGLYTPIKLLPATWVAVLRKGVQTWHISGPLLT